MKQAENSLKRKALLMKITKTASFFFFFSVPFGFPRMLLIVLLSVSKRGAVVISLWKPERIAKRSGSTRPVSNSAPESTRPGQLGLLLVNKR